MKEAERRKNVEIITVDREYDPTQQGGYADGYKPKVRTLRADPGAGARCGKAATKVGQHSTGLQHKSTEVG
jgi:hypothetical protein